VRSIAYSAPDLSASGDRFHLYGSPSLAHTLRQAAIDIPHPTDANRTLWDAKDDVGPFTGPIDKDVLNAQREAEAELKAVSSTGVSPLGSGSDYTVFLQRLGVRTSSFTHAWLSLNLTHLGCKL
jgi:N-acetylated-alpha-linked acidic dipeptidase